MPGQASRRMLAIALVDGGRKLRHGSACDLVRAGPDPGVDLKRKIEERFGVTMHAANCWQTIGKLGLSASVGAPASEIRPAQASPWRYGFRMKRGLAFRAPPGLGRTCPSHSGWRWLARFGRAGGTLLKIVGLSAMPTSSPSPLVVLHDKTAITSITTRQWAKTVND